MNKKELKYVMPPSLHNCIKRILIVDDDPDIRRLIAFQMSLFKYEPVEAANGKDALQLVENGNNFDLVITDANMPELDGFALADALRARPGWSDIPILMVTALDDSQSADKARSAGISKFLGKPLDRSAFKATVQGLLNQIAA